MNLSDSKQITELAFRMLTIATEVSREEKLDSETIDRVTERIRRIRAGLGPELEFVAVVNWLACCLAIHRLDQTPLPKCMTGTHLRIPDILAISLKDGKIAPVLIEVKTSDDDTLVWADAYLQSLQGYADALRLPLLIAWKRGRIWTLTESKHFTKRVSSYHLTWEKAMMENLMHVLFGDELIQLTQRVKFFIDAEITEPFKPLPPHPHLIPEGEYVFKIKAAGFLVDEKPVQLSNELGWVFFCAPDDNQVERTAEHEVRISHTPKPDTGFALTDFVLMLLLWNEPDPAAIDWESIVRRESPIRAENLKNALQAGIKDGIVRYVLRVLPNTMPDFLQS